MNKTILASVLTTITVLLTLGAVGVFAARAAFAELAPVSTVAGAFWHGRGAHGGGHRFADRCARIDENHIDAHAAELQGWVSAELTLDATQATALEAVTGSLGDWALDLRSVCEMPLDDAPAHVAAVVQAAQTTDLALQRFATAFGVFYATLTAPQRAKLDGWFMHEHGSHS